MYRLEVIHRNVAGCIVEGGANFRPLVRSVNPPDHKDLKLLLSFGCRVP